MVKPLLLWKSVSFHGYIQSFKARSSSRCLAPDYRRLTWTSMPGLLLISRWQLIYIYCGTLLLISNICNRSTNRGTFISRTAVLSLIIPVLFLSVVWWSRIMALIQICVELLISLETPLWICSLYNLLPLMWSRLRRGFQHISYFVQVWKKERIIRAVIIYDAVKLRSCHFPLSSHLIELPLHISIVFCSLARHWITRGGWIVHSKLLLRVKPSHCTWRISSNLLNKH